MDWTIDDMTPTYVLLSPTFGMHQYTADYANRHPAGAALVTTTTYPTGPYLDHVRVSTPVTTHNTGFNRAALGPGLRLLAGRDVGALERLNVGKLEGFNVSTFQPSNFPTSQHPNLPTFQPSNLIHFTGPHLWNLPLLLQLRRAGNPTIHTLHDLDPHPGYGRAYNLYLQIWNHLVALSATHVLVLARRYRDRVARWVGKDKVTYAPLLMGFWGADVQVENLEQAAPNDQGFGLFFGRLEAYKGIPTLMQSQMRGSGLPLGLRTGEAVLDYARGKDVPPRVIVAGKGDLSQLWDAPIPSGVEIRNRHIDDDEALDLFRRCAVVVLPYRQATQSAQIAAAYAFRKPVIVTDTGALAEYVTPGQTGWVVPAQDPVALASALDQALGDPAESRRRGEAGRAWYEAQRIEEWATLQAMYQKVAALR